MTIIDRILLVITALILIGLAGSLLWTVWGGAQVVVWFTALSESPVDALISVLLLALIAVYILMMVLRVEERDQKAFVHTSELGEISVSLQTIRGLIIRAARSVKGIKDVVAFIDPGESLRIKLEVQLLPDYHIPKLTEEVQSEVRQYLSETVGLAVDSIEVFVKGVVAESKSRLE